MSAKRTSKNLPPDDLPTYRILTGPDDAVFCHRVSEALALGYKLYGSPAVTFNGKDVIVAQAMIWPSMQGSIAKSSDQQTANSPILFSPGFQPIPLSFHSRTLQVAAYDNRRYVTALIPIFTSKDSLPSESARQLPASFHRSVGNVLFRNCDQNRKHLDAHGGEQLGDGSYRHLLGTAGLPNS